MKFVITIAATIGLICVLSGCASQDSTVNTKRGAVGGAAVGAIAGGIIGHQSGHGLEGAAIGGAVGGAGGAVLGNAEDEKNTQQNQGSQ